MPVLSVFSFFNRFRAMRRNIEKFSAPNPLHNLESSSLNATSKIQWSLFSMCQCSLIALRNNCADCFLLEMYMRCSREVLLFSVLSDSIITMAQRPSQAPTFSFKACISLQTQQRLCSVLPCPLFESSAYSEKLACSHPKTPLTKIT